MKFKFAVIGGGAWGTAIANLLARIDNSSIVIWAKEQKVVDEINSSNKNSLFLKGVDLKKNIYATTNLSEAIAPLIFYVTPAQNFRNIISAQKDYLDSKSELIICSKGIEISSGKLLSDIIGTILPNINFYILSGPSFAHEVASNKPAALVLSSKSIEKSIGLIEHISSKNFRLYPSDDIIGVQLGGAIKNVYAISAGIVTGLNYGENARAALLTRAISEMVRISIALGGNKESIFGLSGIGDMLLTCSSKLSRNFSLGIALGEGAKIQDMIANRKTIAEGYYTTKAIYDLIKTIEVDTPILKSIYDILYKKADPISEADVLLSRPMKMSEFY